VSIKNVKIFVFLIIFIIVGSTNLFSQKGNKYSLGFGLSGAYKINNPKYSQDNNWHYLELDINLGYQMVKNQYLYLHGGRSFSNISNTVYFGGLFSRCFLYKYKFIDFYLTNRLTFNNVTYQKNGQNEVLETVTNEISGFIYRYGSGANLRLYKNFSVIYELGYSYIHKFGFKSYLNFNFQYGF
jgi:hypothetical protein